MRTDYIAKLKTALVSGSPDNTCLPAGRQKFRIYPLLFVIVVKLFIM